MLHHSKSERASPKMVSLNVLLKSSAYAASENCRREKRAEYADGTHAIGVLHTDSSPAHFWRTEQIPRDDSPVSPSGQTCSAILPARHLYAKLRRHRHHIFRLSLLQPF